MSTADYHFENLDLSKDNFDIAVEEMERTWVVRSEDMNFVWNQYLDTKIRGYSRSQANLIGTLTELPELRSAIQVEEGFIQALMRIPAHGKVGMHNHLTIEVVFPLDNTITVMWSLEEENEEGLRQIEIGPLDLIAVPAGVFRGYRNESDRDALVHFTVGAARTAGPIYWPEFIKRKAREAGWELDERGLLRAKV